MTRAGAALVIALGVLASPSIAWAKWTRVSSAHFVFVGDASERDIRNTAERLEQFRQAVGGLFADADIENPVPTVVIVFQNDRSFTPYKPYFNGRPIGVAGYFTPGEDINYIAVNAEQDAAAYGVIFHEYTHFLVRNAIGDAPPWVGEGLAELYQTFEAAGGGRRATLGVPDQNNLRLLQSSPLLPVSELIAVAHDSPMYNEGDRRSLFYAESWALVHELTFGSTGRAAQFKQYLSLLADGIGAPDAFRQAFGTDTALLDRELHDYVRSVRLNALRLDLAGGLGPGRVSSAEPITDAEAAGYLGDMMARLNRVDDARSYLHRTIADAPDAARALMALGLLELRASNDTVAFPLLEKAARLAPDTASIQAAYGRALTMRADRGRADEDELYARARTVLTRALELEPANASTMVTLAEVEMGSAADLPKALSLVQQAVKAAPGREEYRLMLAQALAVNGDYAGARASLQLLIERSSRPEVRDGARRALGRVNAAEAEARRK